MIGGSALKARALMRAARVPHARSRRARCRRLAPADSLRSETRPLNCASLYRGRRLARERGLPAKPASARELSTYPMNRFVRSPYASTRRSRRNGQCVRLNSTRARSQSAISDLLAVDGRAGHDRAVRCRDERLAPELDAVGIHGAAVGAAHELVADAIRRADEAAVGHRVAALNQLPRIVLRAAVLRLLRRMPADRGGVEEHLRALHRRQPRAFGKPLIPADEHANGRVAASSTRGSRCRPA